MHIDLPSAEDSTKISQPIIAADHSSLSTFQLLCSLSMIIPGLARLDYKSPLDIQPEHVPQSASERLASPQHGMDQASATGIHF